jgi:arylsulfate sulfotransferase
MGQGSGSAFARGAFFLIAACVLARAAAAAGFVDQSNVFTDHAVTSAGMTVAGAGTAVPVAVTGGSYSIGCADPFVTTPGTVSDGQMVCVQHRSSGAAGAVVETILDIGGTQHRFSSVTARDNPAAVVSAYYRAILGREADPSGMGFWSGQATAIPWLGANANETYRAIATAFFESPEYRALATSDSEFLVDVYRAFFDRPPDPSGMAHWSAQLAAGMPRGVLLLWFQFSPEFESYMRGIFGAGGSRIEADLVMDLYRGAMNRLPDETGFAFWRARLAAAQCRGPADFAAEAAKVSAEFFGSAEYAGRARSNAEYVGDLYDALLRRGAETAGALFWRDRLDAGVTREEVRAAFVASDEFQVRVARAASQSCATLAQQSALAAAVARPGASPFVTTLALTGAGSDEVSSVAFTVRPKPGANARPVHATLTQAWLARNGYGFTPGAGFEFPVFGLYAGLANAVDVQALFRDGSKATVQAVVTTPAFTDPNAVFDHVRVLQPRVSTALGFDYFHLKTNRMGAVVLDTDGQVRWASPDAMPAFSNRFDRDAFVMGSGMSMAMRRTRLDGASVDSTLAGVPYFQFHHNVEVGKHGLLFMVDETVGGMTQTESVIAEIDAAGRVFREWNVADIIGGFMRANGDDPTTFVRPGTDWFHMNAAAYDARDDSLVLSSRENFLMKIDYATGRIGWILGDPTKYWYTFASLRTKAITLVSGTYPIGQHAVSITPEGHVMVFNNGHQSISQPPGAPKGLELDYSPVSVYDIDATRMIAREVASFDYGRTIKSNFCGSAYRAGGSVLVNYSQADNGAHLRIVGIDAGFHVVFDLELPESGCNSSWNAEPIAFEKLILQ